MMKMVSSNENELSKFVVNMMGCVTSKEPMLLILEYMKYGNLLDFLRAMRAKVFRVLLFCGIRSEKKGRVWLL